MGREGQCCVADEAVAALGNGFDVAGIVGRVAKQIADFLDSSVQAVVEVNEGIGGPESLFQFLAGYDFAAAFEEDAKHLEGLVLEAKASAVFPEFAGAQVKLKTIEAQAAGRWSVAGHGLEAPRGCGQL